MICPCCGNAHWISNDKRQFSEQLTISKLPHSDHPWIAVKFADVVIWANEEWSPMIEYPDGTIAGVPAHMPLTLGYGDADA